jgi:hypothetical protein
MLLSMTSDGIYALLNPTPILRSLSIKKKKGNYDDDSDSNFLGSRFSAKLIVLSFPQI